MCKTNIINNNKTDCIVMVLSCIELGILVLTKYNRLLDSIVTIRPSLICLCLEILLPSIGNPKMFWFYSGSVALIAATHAAMCSWNSSLSVQWEGTMKATDEKCRTRDNNGGKHLWLHNWSYHRHIQDTKVICFVIINSSQLIRIL